MGVVGLTGGIASGKSTVARRFAERGVPVIDADAVAREVVAPGEPALETIRRTFGDGMLLPDGGLDRAAMGELVFADAAARGRLESIVHPAMMARVASRLVALQREGTPWALYEAALIVERGLAPGLAALVVVVCDVETQVARLMARNGLDEAQARSRVAAQTTNEERIAAADYVIENDGTLDALLAQADAVFDALAKRF
ncbi:MAG: dephospho-CoA kinase [Deltaproteobacteria bacterium]|nr:dephospho-CoA kinase [Deltaproteobacteria bacterium]MCB9788342.1 dephospho-CoA kinase [Deltaproteobacteria bacterium]